MERERLVEIIISNGGMMCITADKAADIILSELAKEKTAPAGLVEELRKWIYDYKYKTGINAPKLIARLDEILSRYSSRKEVVLGDGHLVQFVDQTGRPSYYCATMHEGKRGKLVFIEEEGK